MSERQYKKEQQIVRDVIAARDQVLCDIHKDGFDCDDFSEDDFIYMVAFSYADIVETRKAKEKRRKNRRRKK